MVYNLKEITFAAVVAGPTLDADVVLQEMVSAIDNSARDLKHFLRLIEMGTRQSQDTSELEVALGMKMYVDFLQTVALWKYLKDCRDSRLELATGLGS